jgi:hypothetical protein
MTVALVFLIEYVANVLNCFPVIYGCGVANFVQCWTNPHMKTKYYSNPPQALWDGFVSAWPILIVALFVSFDFKLCCIILICNVLVVVLVALAKEMAIIYFEETRENAKYLIEQPIIFLGVLSML